MYSTALVNWARSLREALPLSRDAATPANWAKKGIDGYSTLRRAPELPVVVKYPTLDTSIYLGRCLTSSAGDSQRILSLADAAYTKYRL